MASIVWGREVAEAYDAASASMFDPAVLDPTVDLLAELARGGPALELAVGTGRVALPLSARGVAVSGIELSPHMADQLRAMPGSEAVAVTIGDMTTTRVDAAFKLVCLVWNAIMNVTTQQEQVAVFRNAAGHLEPGGRFVVEVGVPEPHRRPPAELGRVFSLEDDHVGIDTYDDPVGQILSSHHWMEVNGHLVRHSAPYRHVWPSELELMGQLAGPGLAQRWRDGGRNRSRPTAPARWRCSRSPLSATYRPAQYHGQAPVRRLGYRRLSRRTFRAPVGVTTTDEERHDCAVTFGSRTDLVLRYRPDALTA